MRLTCFLLRSNFLRALDYYSNFNPSVLSIQEFLDFGSNKDPLMNSYYFLRKELPVRLANIMKEIQLLPKSLLAMPSAKLVETWYIQSFEEILAYEKVESNSNILEKFYETLNQMQSRHSTVVETMAEGVMQMKEKLKKEEVGMYEHRIHYFLNRFHMSRIGIRLIIHQHSVSVFGKPDKSETHIGCFERNCNVLTIAKDAYENARFICDQHYNVSPVCRFETLKPFEGKEEGKILMDYIPVHLYYMLFELFKNSMRAVVEYHSNNKYPPTLELIVCEGREDVTIKLADQGGGISRKNFEKLFSYMYTTASKSISTPKLNRPPLAGYGYGLPISRLYARYFHGDLILNSVHGYGTDALIYLKLLAKEASELLPVYNYTASQKYTGHQHATDWSHSMDNASRLNIE